VNRFLVAAILCIGFSWTALAQTPADAPASKEDVEKYFEATHSHEMMLKMLEAMSKPMRQMAHDQCAKDKENLPADCEARINKARDDMWKQIPFDEMMQAMVPTFQKHFTKGDMDALVAFYSTPTGQKNVGGNAGSHGRRYGVHDADHAQKRRQNDGARRARARSDEEGLYQEGGRARCARTKLAGNVWTIGNSVGSLGVCAGDGLCAC